MDRRNFLKGTMAVPAVALTAKLPIYKHKEPEYTYTTYGTAKTFQSEGDMYEHLTGHRSSVLDHDKDAMHLDGDRDG